MDHIVITKDNAVVVERAARAQSVPAYSDLAVVVHRVFVEEGQDVSLRVEPVPVMGGGFVHLKLTWPDGAVTWLGRDGLTPSPDDSGGLGVLVGNRRSVGFLG